MVKFINFGHFFFIVSEVFIADDFSVPVKESHPLHCFQNLGMLQVALFSWQIFGFLATVALSFLFDKHCPITE